MGNSSQHTVFLNAWDNARKIQFNEDWNNGTGYYDGAAKDKTLNLQRGELVAAISNPVNNRKLLIKGLGNGLNIVIFERYTDGQNGIIAINKPSRRTLLKSENVSVPHIHEGSLSVHDVELFLSFE